MISYERLWKTMQEKGISQYKLIHYYNFSPGQLTRLRRNNYVSTHTLEILCYLLNCEIQDIVEYIPDK